LLGALVALRRLLRDLSAIAPFLADLGARHACYGVSAEHYHWLVARCAGRWPRSPGQPELTTEWTRAKQTVAQIMIDRVGQSAAAA
jgi:hemoglobin-like flavoprotein